MEHYNSMFCKKSLPECASGLEVAEWARVREQMDQRGVNHEFFLLVRDQKYEEALAVGTLYLQYHPENQSISRFCEFIQGNREQLVKMMEEQQYDTDQSGEDEEDDDEQSDSEDQNKSFCSQASSVSSKSSISAKSAVSTKSVKSTVSTVSKSGRKVQVKKRQKQNVACKVHKWQHVCKQKDCPNKVK